MPRLQLMGSVCFVVGVQLVWLRRIQFHVANYCVLVSLLSYFPSCTDFCFLYCGCVALNYFFDNEFCEVAMFFLWWLR